MRLNELASQLETYTYPMSADDLAVALDGRKLDYPAGEEPLSAVVDRSGSDTMVSADDAWLSIVASVDEGAIGRKFYSDRDPPCGPEEVELVSF